VRNIAIITARSGSKGLIDKNIKDLKGKPLIAYTIEAAILSECFDTVMVSTDSQKYAEISAKYGAEVPFLRSADLASDHATSSDVVLHVLNEYGKMNITYDSVCLLQPTSPLRNAQDIINAYDIYKQKKAFSVVSVTELEHPIAWCGELGENDSLNGFIPRASEGRRQIQRKAYRPNGAMYIFDTKQFLEDQYLYRDGSYAYIMAMERSVDIDTEFDFRFAEFLMENNQNV